jgi:hypothetical protein
VFVLSNNSTNKEADMKPTIIALTLTTLSMFWGPAPAVAGDAKVARGPIASMAGQSVAVTVGDHDMTFRIDNKTTVEARGGSTKTARATAGGKPGVHIDEVLKPGQWVAVSYNDMGGTLQATSIKAILRPSSHLQSNGVVKAIGSDWITINGKSGGGASFEQTLKIDSKTMVLAKGAGTAVAAKGGRAPFTDLIHSGDHVSASYHKVGDGLLASDLRITTKAQ